MSKQINTAIEALSGVIELVILGYDAEAMADDIKIKQLQTKNDTLRTALTETRKLWGIIHGQYKSRLLSQQTRAACATCLFLLLIGSPMTISVFIE